MKIQYISQPFPPDEHRLGHQLKALLTGTEGKFDSFTGIVAFVKFSGVSRIYSALESFESGGGKSIMAVGIDHKGTSKEGLHLLNQRVDQVFVYCDNSYERRTFHPKLYIFEQTDTKAIVILGSGNLTAGGLFTNYESHMRVELDLAGDEEDKRFFQDLLTKCETFFDTTSDCVRELSDELFAELEHALPSESVAEQDGESGKENEDEATGTDASAQDDSQSSAIAKLFGSAKFSKAPRPDVTLPRKQSAVPGMGGNIDPATTPPTTTPPTTTPPTTTPPTTTSPTLLAFWKILSSNDVSLTSSPGQIIIPIMFRDFFEPLPLTKAADAGGKGRQWDEIFPLNFIDGSFRRSVLARCIVYEPETNHPRTNTECRFTFRDRDILQRLSEGDLLVFQQTGSHPRFLVERVDPSDARATTLRATARRYGWI